MEWFSYPIEPLIKILEWQSQHHRNTGSNTEIHKMLFGRCRCSEFVCLKEFQIAISQNIEMNFNRILGRAFNIFTRVNRYSWDLIEIFTCKPIPFDHKMEFELSCRTVFMSNEAFFWLSLFSFDWNSWSQNDEFQYMLFYWPRNMRNVINDGDSNPSELLVGNNSL